MGSGTVSHGAGRRALLDAAVRVTSQLGLRGLTYRSVANEAGVTHGLVAHHFGSRDALISEALSYFVALSIEESGLASTDPGFDGLANRLAALVSRDPDIQAFQYELILESRRRPELVPLVKEMYKSYEDTISAELAKNGLHDPHLTDLVFSALDGLVFRQVAFGDQAVTENSIIALRKLLSTYAGVQQFAPRAE